MEKKSNTLKVAITLGIVAVVGIICTILFSIYSGAFLNISIKEFNIISFIIPMIFGMLIFGFVLAIAIVIFSVIFGKGLLEKIQSYLEK